MNNRRQFLRIIMGFPIAYGIIKTPILSAIRWAFAETGKSLTKNSPDTQALVSMDPATVNSEDLELTDLKDFETMGLTDYEVYSDQWHLKISGRVRNPKELTYAEIKALPSTERKVLLICPGVFANNGMWKGISMKNLLEIIGIEKDVTHAVITGSGRRSLKKEVFPIDDLISNKVFLAYEVNGEILPKKHGFPLRVVAEGYYGDDWVKYVESITFEKH